MTLVNQGGKLLLKNGVLATGQGCCCGGGGGEPCDPCNNYFGAPEYPIPCSRLTGTWDTGSGPVAFDWLTPAGPYVWLNAGWENNSRPPVGMAAVAPFVRINSTLWRWDGATETCTTYVDEYGDVGEGEVPALRTCGGAACAAWFYQAGVNAVMSPREYQTLIANPPPSDNQWYIFLWIGADPGGGEGAWHWAWLPACQDLCGQEVSLSSGAISEYFENLFNIDTFTLTCECGAPCCTGNAEYPVFERPSVCAAQGGHSFAQHFEQFGTNAPPSCLGACCYNDGTADVCVPADIGIGFGSLTLAQCNALGGTWHSGKGCETDDPCNLFP
jgi:hypothetical protein